jgi:hypothetical protein
MWHGWIETKGFRWGKVSEIDNLEGPGVNERIILKWIFRK